ncbi:MAG: NIL domain-containing protein [Acidimicrobiales bacterium]
MHGRGAGREADLSEPIGVRVRLTFAEHLVREPVLARLARRFDVEPNISRANVDEVQGWILCELLGPPQAVEAALGWLQEAGVTVDLLGDVLEG